MKYVCTKEGFLKDIAQHEMTVLRDDGLYRHVRFRRPDTMNMSFDLITWPGVLCYTGDMGTYVFSRLPDMFEFFRTDADRKERMAMEGKTLFINTGYWAEKLQGVDRVDGVKEYSAERFREAIRDQLEHMELSAKLEEEIQDALLSPEFQFELEARQAVDDFTEIAGHEKLFHDFWEVSLEVYTFRYLWCCYAMAWGIEQYDKAKEVSYVADKPTN